MTCSLVGLRVRGEGSTAEDRCVFGKKGQWGHDPKVFAPAPGPVVSVSGGGGVGVRRGQGAPCGLCPGAGLCQWELGGRPGWAHRSV